MTEPFDPDAAAAPGSGLFGLESGPDESTVHVLPVPFDATTSYRRGTSLGPAAVAAASHQVDLYDRLFGRPYGAGIWLQPDDGMVAEWNDEARGLADPIIAVGGRLGPDRELQRGLQRVNELGALVNEHVATWSSERLAAGRIPIILGGDHSVPLGNMRACAYQHPGMGMLHIDAHADLRDAYEGFEWSHASILFNARRTIPGLGSLVQVGLRDLGGREAERISSDAEIHAVFDDDWARARMAGEPLANRVRAAIAALPSEVYLTVDIDGLSPDHCPHTGTPVPGGLNWPEMMLWLELLVESGRTIVGADLVEVSPGPEPDPEGTSWDAVVGARLLYRLIGAALASQDSPPGTN